MAQNDWKGIANHIPIWGIICYGKEIVFELCTDQDSPQTIFCNIAITKNMFREGAFAANNKSTCFQYANI